MPNAFAFVVLLLWPLAIVAMFRTLAVERALIWSILGGYMLLPEATAINLPLIPALTKVTLPNVTAFVVLVMLLGRRITLWPESITGKALIVLFVLGPVGTVLVNPDPIPFATIEIGSIAVQLPGFTERAGLPGLRPFDAISVVGNQLFLMLPLFMARQILATSAALRTLLGALVAGLLVYSLPMWLEIRLSPQLHRLVYGFFHHDFSQAMRFGGFRPFVFMPHGLWVAFFALTGLLAAVALARDAAPEDRPRRVAVAVYLGVLLLACKTLGVVLMALALVPLALMGARMQLRAGAAMGAVALLFPVLRGTGVVPVWQLHDWVAGFAPERAASFAFRLNNEDLLLARASEKLLFGWGTWGRNMIHNPWTGQIETITDGHWIIVIGSFGWLGYGATFGLLALPLLSLWWYARRLGDAELSPWIGPLALILGANMLDLIPNATLVPLTWLIAGALLGHSEQMRRQVLAARQQSLEHRFGAARAGLLGTARPLSRQGDGAQAGIARAAIEQAATARAAIEQAGIARAEAGGDGACRQIGGSLIRAAGDVSAAPARMSPPWPKDRRS